MKKQSLSLLFGGLLPILAFTIIEDSYGPLWGTIAGMVFGVGEIFFEFYKYRKVATVTWISNALILLLGGISVFTQDGIWFKMQPSIIEAFFAFFLWGSLILKKNILVAMAEKQNLQIPEDRKELFKGMTWRLGIFFALHSVLAGYAAFFWSTAAWAWLKGLGLTLSLFVYMAAEVLWIRYKARRSLRAPK